ncbi:MAG: cytochrome P450 [Pyrinomonadaceae bacterium]
MKSLRLYPPAWRIGRRVIKDYEVGDSQLIPAGSLVLLSQYVMHRDPRLLPDPERFDPERWTAKVREERPQFSYFPFWRRSAALHRRRVCANRRDNAAGNIGWNMAHAFQHWIPRGDATAPHLATETRNSNDAATENVGR